MSTSTTPSFIQWALSDVKSILLVINFASLVETFLYGIHFGLFAICMYILSRNKGSIHWFIPTSAFVMFAISTADISITFRMMGDNILLLNGSDLSAECASLLKRFYPKNLLFVADNFVAEMILLYRCYLVWNRSKYVLLVGGPLVLADTVWGFLGMSQSLLAAQSKFIPVFMWSVFALNIGISGITAGRILWLSRVARPVIVLGKCNVNRYHTAVAVLIESSSVYSACLLFSLIFSSRSSPYEIVMYYMCMRVVAIMPTLLIVQVGLDRILTDSNRYRERPLASVAVVAKHINKEASNSGFDHEVHVESAEGQAWGIA